MKNCGNPFTALFPNKNDACVSPHLLSLLNDFETSLKASFTELAPKDDDKKDFITVSWMIQAMHSLCETHQIFNTFMTTYRDLLVSGEDRSLVFLYSEFSSKLLKLFSAFDTELTRLNIGILELKFAFSKPEDISLSHLDRWRKHMASENPSIEIEKCGEVLSSVVESMNRHHYPSLYEKVKKKKQYAKEKLLVRALYGLQVETLFIFTVFDAAFTRSSKNLLYLTIPEEMEVPWGQAFMELENMINPEIKNTFLPDRFSVIRDLEAVEFGVEKLCAAAQEGGNPNLLMVEPLKQSVMELSDRFDLIDKEKDCLFKAVISARDALI